MAVSVEASVPILGETYPIVEKDAISEIEDRSKQLDWETIEHSVDPRKSQAFHSVSLPSAKKDRSYEIDMSYTLQMDIPDGKGGVIYPKGYRFNPLAYMTLPYRIAVIDGSDADIAWARAHGDDNVMWLTAGGDPYELSKKLGVPVYLYTDDVAKRLQVRAVPAMVAQKGQRMFVKETPVNVQGRATP